MPIMLPLTILGAGFLLYQIFAGATLALPLAIGAAAGFGANAIGLSLFASFAIGTLSFMAVIVAGRFVVLTFTGPYARAAIIALYAIPAGVAGFAAANAIASLAGFAGSGIPLLAAVACAAVAAHRLVRPAI